MSTPQPKDFEIKKKKSKLKVIVYFFPELSKLVIRLKLNIYTNLLQSKLAYPSFIYDSAKKYALTTYNLSHPRF